MAILKIRQEQRETEVYFEGQPGLDEVLRQAGFLQERPCGGRGTCGKCKVELLGDVSAPNDAEQKAGGRLSCQAHLQGDATVILPALNTMKQIEVPEAINTNKTVPMEGRYGAAVDIGTTTLALHLYNLESGTCVGTSARENPQRSVAADVMGRIDAAMRGQQAYLKDLVTNALDEMIKEVCEKTDIPYEEVDTLVISGNTTMLYLLTGRDTDSLSRAPFIADWLFDETIEILGKKAYLPPCMNAFVGADITAAVLTSGMCNREEIALLCDIGTNGEIALWKDGVLYVTSTAAGPAFEGAGISCGCGSISGAIDRVWTEDGRIKTHTIDGAPAVGICGSGIIDAIAVLLSLEEIDETGAMEKDVYLLADSVYIRREDVREVQLAKAAIAAGIETLLETAGVEAEEIGTFYLAGGFGTHLNVGNAAVIGLIMPKLQEKIRVIGNASLTGAARILLCKEKVQKAEKITECSKHVALGGNPVFNDKYIESMFF